jgi:hypothetical protein
MSDAAFRVGTSVGEGHMAEVLIPIERACDENDSNCDGGGQDNH